MLTSGIKTTGTNSDPTRKARIRQAQAECDATLTAALAASLRKSYTVRWWGGEAGFDTFEAAVGCALRHRSLGASVFGEAYDGPEDRTRGLTDDELERLEEEGL